jgi:hypothetical protein
MKMRIFHRFFYDKLRKLSLRFASLIGAVIFLYGLLGKLNCAEPVVLNLFLVVVTLDETNYSFFGLVHWLFNFSEYNTLKRNLQFPKSPMNIMCRGT